MSYDKIREYAECNGGDLEFGDPYGRDFPQKVTFHAFLQEMNQTFSLSYDSEEVYGRNDPIMSYRNTKRSMSLSFVLPATNLYHAKTNRLLTRILIRKLYPRYENIRSYDIDKNEFDKLTSENEALSKRNAFAVFAKTQQHQYGAIADDDLYTYYYLKERLKINDLQRGLGTVETITGGAYGKTVDVGFKHTQTMVENPMITLKYSNLISDRDGLPLFGYLDSLNVKPLLDEGYFSECSQKKRNPITGKEELIVAGTYPKVYQVSCNFNIIHELPLGWNGSGIPLSNIFDFRP
tara:strand:+ start:876 stop:1754 length:879 start_codon:yes stop_codon:yes gene_type:complete